MLDLMTWQEIVDQLLSEGQFKMAVIFDPKGEILAASEGAMIDQHDAKGVFKTMEVNNNTICGIFVAGAKFSCLTIDKNSIVGWTNEHDIFIAHRDSNMLICATSEERADYSCIGFIKTFMDRLYRPPPGDETQPLELSSSPMSQEMMSDQPVLTQGTDDGCDDMPFVTSLPRPRHSINSDTHTVV